jgi:hypothetical protein
MVDLDQDRILTKSSSPISWKLLPVDLECALRTRLYSMQQQQQQQQQQEPEQDDGGGVESECTVPMYPDHLAARTPPVQPTAPTTSATTSATISATISVSSW